ncbi:hypothetical protein Thiowin_01191 [Thiorhodovibrio winogradskyi]|uniref:Uncharacterized protein n=1 Tax=Thiorhodovibrio winogradskyi TaxID=77007 RepID=A0ABZ0S5F2_9GAMM
MPRLTGTSEQQLAGASDYLEKLNIIKHFLTL